MKGSILIITFLLSFSFLTVLHAQGGEGMTPTDQYKLEEKTDLTELVGQDVSTSNGALNVSYPVGTVSTLKGNSFTLTITNSSRAIATNNLPAVKDGVVGEGWSMNVPSISLSVSGESNFTYQRLDNIRYYQSTQTIPSQYSIYDLTPYFGTNTTIDWDKLAKEGKLYFFNIKVNIPGVYSGDMVYKYAGDKMVDNPYPPISGPENNIYEHVFVPEQFERYFELRYDGLEWILTLDDGTKYVFSDAIYTQYEATNQRVNVDALMTSGSSEDYIKDNFLPRYIPTQYYCSSIRFKDDPDVILFEYEGAGSFDRFKEARSNEVDNYFNHPGFPYPNENIEDPADLYSEKLLKRISSRIRTLDLHYEIDQDFLDKVYGNGVIDPESLDKKDIRYYKRTIEHWTINTENFNSYQAPAKTNSGISDAQVLSNPSPNNPFTFSHPLVTGKETYLFQGVKQPYFDYSILESPKIALSKLKAGNIYEVRAKIKSLNHSPSCMFDINVVTGNSLFTTYNKDANVGSNNTTYNHFRPVSLFNTFNRGIKWSNLNRIISAGGNDIRQTSNYFTVPVLAPQMDGVYIQIGPGNNEQIYTLNTANMDEFTTYGCDLIDNDIPHSIHKFYNSFHADNQNNIGVPKSGDRMRGHFGTGYPWLCLSDMYGGSYYKFGLRSNPFDQNETQGLGDATWWCPKNLQNTAMCYIENKPVKADPSISLHELDLVEYIKMPLVLKSAASKVTDPSAHVDIQEFSPADIYQLTDSVVFVYKNVIKSGYGVGYYDMSLTESDPYYLQTTQVFSLLREIHSKKIFDDEISSDPLITKFGSYEYRSGELLPEDFIESGVLPTVYNSPTGYYAFLLDTIRQVNGKQIYYTYNNLNFNNFRLRSNVNNLELFGRGVFGRESAAKKYGPANGFSSTATIEVSTKSTDYFETGRLTYKYTYDTRVEKTSSVNFISYLQSLNSHNLHYYPREIAFTTVAVVGPYTGSVPAGPKIVYHNKVDANSPLFGKTEKIVKYNDPSGGADLLSETEYYYNQEVAYLPGTERGNMHYYRYDYEDLETSPPDPDLGLSSRPFHMPLGDLPNGKTPEFLGNQAGLTLYSSSYFTALEKVITREYIPADGGIKKEKKVEYEYCGAGSDGAPYTGWKNAFLYGNIPSRLRYEPSWQPYKVTTTVGDQVDVVENFYLWDLMNIVTYEKATDFTIGLDCFRKMDRTRLIHKRVTRAKGSAPSSRTNEYYVYKEFEPVSDATVVNISTGNAQCPQNLDIPDPDPVLFEKQLIKTEEDVNEFPAYLNTSARLTNVPVFNFPVIRTRKVEKYNQNLQVTEEFDVNDVKTTYDYGSTTRINVKHCYTIGADPAIHVDNYSYDICPNYGAPVSITREHGNQEYVTSYTGERGKLKTVTDPAGNTTANTYDGHMRVIVQKLNGSKMKELAYKVNPQNQHVYEMLMMGNYVTVKNYYTASLFNTSVIFTGLDGQQLCVVDNGVVRDNKIYDHLGRMVEQRYPFTGTQPYLVAAGAMATTMTYSYLGNTDILSGFKNFQHTDKLIVHEYAKNVNVATLASSAGITYPGSGGPDLYSHTVTDQDGKKTTTVYNQAGQVLLTTSDDGAIGTAFTYHSTGGVERIVNPNGLTTVNHYNHFGQVYNTQSPYHDADLLYAYDKAGNRVLSSDGEEVIRRYTYDGFNQMTGQYKIDADPEIFDEKGLLPVLEPGTGSGATATPEKELFYGPVSASQFTGLLGSLNPYFTHGGYPGKPSATKSYNRDGKPVEYTGLTYNTVTGEVGGMGRQFNPNSLDEYGENYATSISYGDQNYLSTPRSKTIDLNADGTPDFYYWYVYDNYNRLSEVYANFTNSKTNGNKIVTYFYEPLTRLLGGKSYYATNKTGTDPTCTTCHVLAETFEYAYDLQGRLTNIGSRTMGENIYYDANSIIDGVAEYPNYNGNINSVQFRFSQVYQGNPPPTLIKNSSWEYVYDGANRLISADYYRYSDDVNYTTAQETYAYDAAGNTMELDLIRANMTPYVVDIDRDNANSRITGVDIAPPQPSVVGASGIYSHDGNGTITDYGKASMYNVKNGRSRMPEAFHSGMIPANIPVDLAPNNIMYYDAFDQRIFKAVFSNTKDVSVSKTMEYYVRDDRGRELAVYDMNKKHTTWYIYGLDRVAEISHEAACLVPVIIPNEGGPGGPGVYPPYPPGIDTLDCYDKYEWSIKHDGPKFLDFNSGDKAKVTSIGNNFVKDSCYDKYEYYNHYLLHTVRRSGVLELAATAQLSDPNITEVLDTFPVNPNTQMLRLRGLDGALRIAEMRQVLGDTMPRQLVTPGPGSGTGTAQIFESCQSRFKYYVYDHLGNTRIVYGAEATCGESLARLTLTSMTDYSPYGNILQRYAFQGRRTRFMTTYHERDSSTLLDYRGARFSDAEVGGFLSLDPLADKFPGWSPYNYVMCNPIKMVDSDGKAPTDIIIVLSRNSQGKATSAVEYSGGKLYNLDGTAYKGNNQTALMFQAGLNELSRSDNYFREGIEQLVNSSDVHMMEIDNSRPSGVNGFDIRSGQTGRVSMDGLPIPGGSQMTINLYQKLVSGEYGNFFTMFAHEISHSFDYHKGTYSNVSYPDGQQHKDPDEIRAVNIENRYRRNANLELRTHYGKAIDPSKLEDPCQSINFCEY